MTEEVLQFNKDELNPPSFLDFAYFEHVLRTSENDKNLKLIEHKIVPGTKPGDHFASIMFKIFVTYTSRGKTVEKRSLILKTVPVEGLKKDVLTEMPLFENEIKMYTKVLPEMERIMRNVGETDVLGIPRLVYQSTEPPVVILDDVTTQGFEMVYQTMGFDNIKLVIDEIAKFHALSLIIEDEKTEDIHFESAFMSPKFKESAKMFMGGVLYLINEMKSWPGFEKIHEKLEGKEWTIMDKMAAVFNPNKEFGYSVLNHGDFHIRNMMFKKTGDKIEDVLMLDFQAPFWGTPAVDLAYLILLVGNEEVRDRRSEVYLLYHRKLSSDLAKYGYMKQPPSLLDINLEVLKYGVEELFMMLFFMPMFFVDFTKIDMEQMFKETGDAAAAHNAAVYKNPELVALMQKHLPQYLYKGYMD